MTTAVLWKEYRQQRVLWLSVAGLGILIALALIALFGDWPGMRNPDGRTLRGFLIANVVALTVAYGVVSGALLLAGESEDGTLVFLDNLTGRRSVVWARKCGVGLVFTLAQCVVMSVLAVGLGIGKWDEPPYLLLLLPLLGVDALAWGLLAGALCRTVLGAVLAGVAMMFLTWCFNVVPLSPALHALVRSSAAAVAAYGSWRVFCQADIQRRLAKEPFESRSPSPWRVLPWLMIRQGRWVLLAGLAGAVLVLPLGNYFQIEPFFLWSAFTLILGGAFGLAAFAPDQNEGNRFLAAQRFTAGWIWTAKVAFWGFAAALMLAPALVVGWAMLWLVHDHSFTADDNLFRWLQRSNLTDSKETLVAWLTLWPLYGFAFGQFFGLIARRPVIGAILTFAITPMVLVLWMPTLLLGGVSGWQFLLVPAVLLVTTRLAYWPWTSGRLWTARPLGGIAGAAVLMVLCMAACLWLQFEQVPDVGEPFDVEAFLANLPIDETGPKAVRTAAAEMVDYEALTRGRIDAERFYQSLSDVLERGWLVAWRGGSDEDKKTGEGLDILFEQDWVTKAETAARSKLGVIQNPRHVFPSDLRKDYRYPTLGLVIAARALQLKEKQDGHGSLSKVKIGLALSRQVKNYAAGNLLFAGNEMENQSLAAYLHLLRANAGDKELLLAGLAMLHEHEAASPDPANSIKAAYVAYLNGDPNDRYGSLFFRMMNLSSRAPWEKERVNRMLNAITLSSLGKVQKPYLEPARKNLTRSDLIASYASEVGLPPKEGPGSSLTVLQWGTLINDCRLIPNNYRFLWLVPNSSAQQQANVHILELVTAVWLYRIDHKALPAKLADLVPTYLDAVPVDAFGDTFHYRIASQDENLEGGLASHLLHNGRKYGQFALATGQGLIFSKEQPSFCCPVGAWRKGDG